MYLTIIKKLQTPRFREIEEFTDRIYIDYVDNILYEIELETGKSPWAIKGRYEYASQENSLKLFPNRYNSNPEGDNHFSDQLLLLDLKNRQIQWALSLKNGGIWDSYVSLRIVDGPLSLNHMGYLDLQEATGKVLVFYPKTRTDKFELLESIGNYRFLYDWDKKTILQCIVK